MIWHEVAIVLFLASVNLQNAFGDVNLRSCDASLCSAKIAECRESGECDCDMSDARDCSCCEQCKQCMQELFLHCYDCLDVSRTEVDVQEEDEATVIELRKPSPDLFHVLTKGPDPQDRWRVMNYSESAFLPHGAQGGEDQCTVAYMNQCMSPRQCKQRCTAMGAASLRWYDTWGCCQCTSPLCVTDGPSHPHCPSCGPQMYTAHKHRHAGRHGRQRAEKLREPSLMDPVEP